MLKIKKWGNLLKNIPKNAKDMCQDENGHYVHASGKRVLVGENKFNQPVTDFTSDKHYSVYFNKLDDDIILKFEDSLMIRI
ncbi:Uncharacterised protein [Mannheimia haemolytica]|uniref:Uncharacterized protein n=1 Tax=Mannheimia haemolytica TaxID=75985 RepID=A0A378N6X7_MANHA|nr:Uncharacterised protein [Mannheimia haemolytica]